jgi:hypothetical protein
MVQEPYSYRPRDTSAEAKTRRFVGTYEFDLSHADGRWRIAKFKYNLKFIDGVLELEKAT